MDSFVPAQGCDNLAAQVVRCISAAPSDTLLTPRILSNFKEQTAIRSQLVSEQCEQDFHACAQVFICDADTYMATPLLQQELFGPAALIVCYESEQELIALITQFDGQLTASIHGTDDDMANAAALKEALQYKVARLIENQLPTGVEMCTSKNHGGPFPSSTDVRSTSVGTHAMLRFMRPICYQP